MPNSLALSPSSRVHSQFQPQPQLRVCVSGAHEALHFGSAGSFPGTSPAELSQHTPPAHVIVVQPREFQVKKPRDECLQEPLWSWMCPKQRVTPARWVPDWCLLIDTFVSRRENWTIMSQHSEKMLCITWVCLIYSSLRKPQLCANSELNFIAGFIAKAWVLSFLLG